VNAAVATELLAGRTGPVRDVVLLNAAATLVAWEGAVGADSLNEAFGTQLDRAAEAVDSGAAKVKLAEWVAATRSFR
jgi:anthranilate phosphoribosyltransferase